MGWSSMLLRPFATASVLLACATGLHAEPLPLRNQHPLVQLFGLPSPLPARLPGSGTGSVQGVINWSSFAVVQANATDEFTLDGEALEARVILDRAVAPRVALHAEVAWRQLDGGVLDPLIDDFHDLFGLPDGSRPQLPHDQLRIAYARRGVAQLTVDDDRSGFVDLPLAAGWQWLASDAGALAAWLTLKLPTGQPDALTGSGAPDVALSLAAQRHVGSRWQLFGQVNAAWLGRSDVLGAQQRDVVGSALAGATWRAWRGLELTAQVDANTKVFDADLEGLDGAAVVLSFGASYRTQRAWRFDFGLSEDLKIDASPDVVFMFAARHGF
jgi:hypothetical protein